MKAVLQRVSKGSVSVDNSIVGAIGQGLVILLCVEHNDTEEEARFLSRKCTELRIFADDAGKMNRSLAEVGGSVLLISQFTLAADWKKGRRPGFTGAAAPQEANRLYEFFVKELENLGIKVERGIFGAHMDVSLVNDGPVTLILDHQNNNGSQD